MGFVIVRRSPSDFAIVLDVERASLARPTFSGWQQRALASSDRLFTIRVADRGVGERSGLAFYPFFNLIHYPIRLLMTTGMLEPAW